MLGRPSALVRVHRGDNVTFSFRSEMDYRVQLQIGDRILTGNAGSSYTLENIQADTELTIRFVRRAIEDSLIGTDRVIHRLQSLAKTGGIMPVAIIGLMGVAFAAAGIAVLAASRRRKRATR